MDYGLVCHLGAGVAAPTSLQLPKLEVSVLLSGTVTEVNRLGNFPNKDKVLGHESHSYLQQVSTATPVLHNQSSCRSHHPSSSENPSIHRGYCTTHGCTSQRQGKSGDPTPTCTQNYRIMVYWTEGGHMARPQYEFLSWPH